MHPFFEKGSDFNILTEDADRLLELMRASTWREPKQSSGGSSPDVVSWSNLEPPAEIAAFWKKFADHSYLSFFVTHYGEFSKLKMSAHRWHAGNFLGWHNDFHEALGVNVIIYLGDRQWSDGELEIGSWRVDRNGFGDPNEVRRNTIVRPEHGSVVTLFNGSPMFCHRVKPMAQEREKYSLICRFGYEENYSKSSFASRM